MNCIQRKSKRIATLLLAFLLGVSALSSVAAEKPAAEAAPSLQFSILGGKRLMRTIASRGIFQVFVVSPKKVDVKIGLYEVSNDGSKEKEIETEIKGTRKVNSNNNAVYRAIHTVKIKNKEDLKGGCYYEVRVTENTASKKAKNSSQNSAGGRRFYVPPTK